MKRLLPPWLIIFLVLCCFCQMQAQEWKLVSVPPPPDVNQDYWLEVFFLPSNPNFGWVVGMHRRTMRTTDGGKTWERSSVPGALPNAFEGNFLEGLIFLDSLVGYCSGPAGVFKSQDGGRTWRDIRGTHISGGVWGCYFISRDTGMVGVGGCASSVIMIGDSLVTVHDPQNFYRTTDGGMTWTVFQGNEPASGLTDIRLLSSQGLGYATSSGRIWKTQNGGVSWNVIAKTRTAISLSDNPWQEEISLSGSSILVPTAGTDCSGGNNTGSVRMSPDNGATWREFITRRRMFGCFLLNDSTGWACGDEAAVIYTQDYGKTWTVQNCGINPSANIDDLWFINDTTGWAAGQGLYRYIPPSERIFTIQHTPKQPVYCLGDSVVLSVPDNWRTYVWSTGDTARTIVVKNSGTYFVKGQTFICTQQSDTVQFTFLPLPEARIIRNKTGRLCEGDTLIIGSASRNPGLQYQWSSGGQIVSRDAEIRVTRSADVTLTVINPSGCRVSTTETITIFPRPNTTIQALRSTQFCIGDSTILEAPPGFVRYSWSDGVQNGITTTQRITVKATGRYFVALTDGNGCEWASQTIETTRFNFTKQLFIISPLENNIFMIDSTVVGDVRCRSMVIQNRDTIRTVVVPSVSISRNLEFSVPPSQFPFIVPPNSQKALTICYNPSRVAIQRDTIFVADSCGSTPVPLASAGKTNTFEGTSQCDVSLLVRSIGSGRVSALTASLPIPNPASSEVVLFVEQPLSSTVTNTFRCIVYNLMGNIVAEAGYQQIGKRTIDNVDLVQGQFTADISKLSSGTYFVVIQTKQGALPASLRIER